MPYPTEVPRSYWNEAGEKIDPPRPIWRPSKGHEKPGEDDFVLFDHRQARRAQQRAQRGERRKMQRRFVRREWAKEREQNQLAQLFNITDGLVPSDPLVQRRAERAIEGRIERLQDQDPSLTPEDIVRQLRGLAKTAHTVVPK